MYNDRILLYEYGTMEKELRNLLYQYQEKLWIDSLGKSFDDREIYRIIVGNKNAGRKLLFTGTIHGREYMTAKLLVKQTEYFLQNICKNGIENYDVAIHIIPMVNPDGAALCHRGINGIRNKKLKEKLLAMKEEDFMKWKSNARGVDLNRNFAAFWGGSINVKNKNLPQNNIRENVRSQKWKQNFLLSLQGKKNFRQPLVIIRQER